MKKEDIFPFTAIVGHEELKLALVLNAVDITIGGVLAIGDKGTGKTTLVRSFSDLMNIETPFAFVNVPIGVSEDRMLGNIHLETLINHKKERVSRGLLAKAHNGMLYIDEVNLLNDYLTDILLDASASGYYFLEREGVSKKFQSRFCLVGSMNPEEGVLRPQLKDRFGLSANVQTSQNKIERQNIIKYRMSFDQNPKAFHKRFRRRQQSIYDKIQYARDVLYEVKIPEKLISMCCDIALQHGVEGHRTDVILAKTARAYAAFIGKRFVKEEHIEYIAPLVLMHRSKKKAFLQSNIKRP